MPSGGKRTGAGKKPTTPLTLTPQTTNLLREKAKEQESVIVEQLLKLAATGDKTALKFVMEQMYGKAGTQEVTDKPTQIILQHNVPRPPLVNPTGVGLLKLPEGLDPVDGLRPQDEVTEDDLDPPAARPGPGSFRPGPEAEDQSLGSVSAADISWDEWIKGYGNR